MNDERLGRVEVQALACPKCGSPITGSGACGSCSQLLLVTREYGVLNVSDQDIQGIEITPPQQNNTKPDPHWGFTYDALGFSYKQSALTILGFGSPAVGARLVAMYYTDHSEALMPGSRNVSWRDISDYSIAKALSKRNGS